MWNGEDLFKAVLLGGGSGGSSGGGSSGGGIPQADIDAAFAALAEKGVTVPDGATSADLDDLIASIVTGGGASIVATGTITPTESVHSVEITHNLGSIPHIAICYRETQENVIRDDNVVPGTQAFAYSIDGTNAAVLYKTGSTITGTLSVATMATSTQGVQHGTTNTSRYNVIGGANESTCTLYTMSNNSSVLFAAGNTYRWVMVAKEVS